MSVRNALLALLIPGPNYGYELRNQLERVTGSLRSTNIGQVYSTLSRLERDGLVLRTMSTHPVGLAREQVRYALTDSGRVAAHEWFGQPQAAVVPLHDELITKLALAASLPDTDLGDVIAAQKAAVAEEMLGYELLRAHADPSDANRMFVLQIAELRAASILGWLERCQQN